MGFIIGLAILLAYWLPGLFVARNAYVRLQREWEAEVARRGPHRSRPVNEAGPMSAVVFAFWPFWGIFQWVKKFFQAPLIRENQAQEKREEQLKFWTARERDTSISVAERQVASQVLKALKGE